MNLPPGEDEDKLITKTQEHEALDFSGQSPILSCPKCNHFIKGSDVNIEETIAKCSHCDHVFAFEHDSNSLQLKPVPVIPEGIETLKLRSELDIRLKWFNTTTKGGRKFLTLFAAVWNLMLLPFVLVVVLTGQFGILLFLSLHLLVGLGLLWHLGTVYFNRTSILINKHKLKVRTIPFRHFLWPNREIAVKSIRQLYVTKYVQSTTNGVPNYAYALYAIVDKGEKQALLRGMNRETQVYIETEIENFLGIKNRHVPEEDKSK